VKSKPNHALTIYALHPRWLPGWLATVFFSPPNSLSPLDFPPLQHFRHYEKRNVLLFALFAAGGRFGLWVVRRLRVQSAFSSSALSTARSARPGEESEERSCSRSLACHVFGRALS